MRAFIRPLRSSYAVHRSPGIAQGKTKSKWPNPCFPSSNRPVARQISAGMPRRAASAAFPFACPCNNVLCADSRRTGTTLDGDHLAEPGFWPTQSQPSREDFVGPEACARCHAAKTATQTETPMARNLMPAAVADILHLESRPDVLRGQIRVPNRYRCEPGRIFGHEWKSTHLVSACVGLWNGPCRPVLFVQEGRRRLLRGAGHLLYQSESA